MKKFIIALSVFAALSLFDSSIASAEPTHPNEIGLYMNEDGTGATGTYVVGTPVEVYLVLTKPTDLSTGYGPINFVHSWECQLNFDPVPNYDLFKLAETLPPGSILISNSNITDGYLYYAGGRANPTLPVTDESIVLMTLTFLNTVHTQFLVTLGPCDNSEFPCNPPHEMWFATNEFSLDPDTGVSNTMHPVSGSHDAPVFIFNGEAVPTESQLFGSVKALYR